MPSKWLTGCVRVAEPSGPSATVCSRSWPFRRGRPASPGATSVAPSTASRRRASAPARTAGRRSSRTACARRARRTAAAKSSRCAHPHPRNRDAPCRFAWPSTRSAATARPRRSSPALSRRSRPRSSRSCSARRTSTRQASSTSSPTAVVAMDDKPAEAVPSQARLLTRPRRARRRRRSGRRSRVGRQHGRDTRCGAPPRAAPARCAPAGDRRRDPHDARARRC